MCRVASLALHPFPTASHSPLLPTRLSHWLNYRYDTTGFLHWGLNYWAGAKNGIRDYELLRLLGQESSAEAAALCRRVVTDPYNYVSDVKTFRAERRTLLELLSR